LGDVASFGDDTPMAIRIFREMPGAFGRDRGFIAAISLSPSLRNQGLPKEDLWSSMDRARAPRVTEPLARAVLEHAKRSWGGVGRCVVIYHVRGRVTDEKERHLPRPPHSSASPAIADHGRGQRPWDLSFLFDDRYRSPIRHFGSILVVRFLGPTPLSVVVPPLPLISGAALGSLRAWCVAPV
jgi:hypothetical protein